MAKQVGSTASAQNLTIDASPTKELFIDMLTRDVALIPAILDLADNSTDGARRTCGEGSWSEKWISISAKENEFKIADNCGGISVDVARNYAFRFGRPVGAQVGHGEVGRFGVGMKRGLFKLGRHFRIVSTTKNSKFQVTIDVDRWSGSRDWNFKFDEMPVEKGSFPLEERGTTITVTKLHSTVKEHFQETGFLDQLRQELTSKLENSILRGLAVNVNSVSLKAHARTLVSDKALAPSQKSLKARGPTGGNVNIEIWCGLGKPESLTAARAESGWYVFCNGRMLLQADKTSVTGWGVEDEESIPAYHPQYNGFRGLVYMDAEDAVDLPWNTTKTALDTDHPVYRRVRQEMIALARPVINYFNKKKEENDALKAAGEESVGKLQALFDEATVAPLDGISPRKVFTYPVVRQLKIVSERPLQKIVFQKPLDLAKVARRKMGVSTWQALGEQLFDYYYKAECEE
jgi:hypothetical protein